MHGSGLRSRHLVADHRGRWADQYHHNGRRHLCAIRVGNGRLYGFGRQGPTIRNGGNLLYDFEVELENGVACPQYAFMASTTAVLGVLPPGNHTLTTTSWGTPVATNNFTVPINSMPTLRPAGFGTDGSFTIQLTGVPHGDYILQRSTNLVNWTSLSTNSAGPLLIDRSSNLPGRCFYRVQIIENSSISTFGNL
jgi:hypothetical protein